MAAKRTMAVHFIDHYDIGGIWKPQRSVLLVWHETSNDAWEYMLKNVKGHQNHILADKMFLILCYTEVKGQQADFYCNAGWGNFVVFSKLKTECSTI